MNNKAGQTREGWYFSNIEDTLALAGELFRSHGSLLLGNQEISGALARLRLLEDDLARQMRAMGMGIRCGECAARAGGGCCSAYMTANTDSILLLINMLLGGKVAFVRGNGTQCRYLGPEGCSLLIKPIFCLNYNCSHIRDAATDAEMAGLEERAARLLSAQTGLEALLVEQILQA